VERLAEVKGVPFQEVAEITTQNAKIIYEIDCNG
jgi:Tat protein secretion system quality control protein TatD with DNase activity